MNERPSAGDGAVKLRFPVLAIAWHREIARDVSSACPGIDIKTFSGREPNTNVAAGSGSIQSVESSIHVDAASRGTQSRFSVAVFERNVSTRRAAVYRPGDSHKMERTSRCACFNITSKT